MAPGSCSYCGTARDRILRCKGTCGGTALYCNVDCQCAHRKAGHKRECWTAAASNTFTIPHPEGGGRPDVPLRALRQLDGFGRSGLGVYYSDHLGEEATRPVVVDFFGKVDDEMGWNAEGLRTIAWCAATNPVYDEAERAMLKPGEACFNTDKSPAVVEALLREGIITDTGKSLQIGLYPHRHPVCRINLPVHVNSDDEDDEE